MCPRHEKGIEYGYIITFGDKRIYIAGDTEFIPEMLEINDITLAFLGFSKYNMDIEMFVDAITNIIPTFVVPYYYDKKSISELIEEISKVSDVYILNGDNENSAAENTQLKHSLNCFPNPANNYLYIPDPEIENLTIHDIEGRNVTSKIKIESQNINTSALKLGIYFISYNHDKELFNGKFIISR